MYELVDGVTHLPIRNGTSSEAIVEETRRVRVGVDEPAAIESLAAALDPYLHEARTSHQEIVVVCIGTDRSTGDALGPLVGSMLADIGLRRVAVYGTLEEPVHAANLAQMLDRIADHHVGSLVIAVDACLGRSENVGTISLKHGPLQPGTGVNKALPEIGTCHIIGVVNVGGFMEYFVLQNTRLGLVVRMARTVAQALATALGGHLVTPVTRSLNSCSDLVDDRDVAVVLE